MRGDGLRDLLRLVVKLADEDDGVTITDVEREFKVSRSTAERMLRQVRKVIDGMAIVTGGDRVRRWRITPKPISAFLAPTAGEMTALDTTARALKADGSIGQADALLSLGCKVRLGLKGPLERNRLATDFEVLHLSEGSLARPGPKLALSADMLAVVRQAQLENRTLIVRYRLKGSTSVRERTVELGGLVHGRTTYLIAVEPGKTGAVTFRFDLIQSLLLGPCSKRDEPFSIDDYLAPLFGIWQEPAIKVGLRFRGAAAREATQYHFHRSQVVQEEADGAVLVTLIAGGQLEMFHHLVIWGDDVEIAEPADFRLRMADWAGAIARHHATGPPIMGRDVAAISQSGETNMSLFNEAEMTTFYASGDDVGLAPCRVRMEDGGISVMYDEEGGEANYSGRERGPGHYELSYPAKNGRATLHHFPDSAVLEGFWVEDGYEGMWRITLKPLAA